MTMRKHIQTSAKSHSGRRRNQTALTAGLLAALIAAGGAPLASLADGGDLKPILIREDPAEMTLRHAHYNAFTGVIEDVTPHHSLKDTLMLRLQGEGEALADFVISKETVLSEHVVLEVGQTITGWYDARKPMILIYPPQYTIELITAPGVGVSHKADYFDENLVSADGTLKLNLEASHGIRLWDREGSLYEKDLSGKRLLVTYSTSTRSLPAQTLPESVYVVEENLWLTPAGQVPVLVNGSVVHGPSAQMTEDKLVMVPLRAVAEALGLEVQWLPDTQTVIAGKASLTLGQDAYAFARMAPMALGAAPVVREGRTFVPLDFFGQVLPGLSAEMKEGKVWVNVNPEA